MERRPGRPSDAGARIAFHGLLAAIELARTCAVDAICTAPINKEGFARAGLATTGHTEILAERSGAAHVRLMMAHPKLRIVLATTHLALAEVPRLLTVDEVARTIVMTADWLRGVGASAPRIAMAGLNPHAGEGGLLGSEEEAILRPAVLAAEAAGVAASGPWPADTVFVRAVRGEFDAVVACYHDQGLIPVKLLAFGQAVNVTIGLPIIRTSVDHGTAFDIAGRGVADPASLITAVRLAARLAGARR